MGRSVTVGRRFSIAEAVAIGEGKVLHVGRSLEMQPYIRPETRVIELGGKCVILGLRGLAAAGERAETAGADQRMARVRRFQSGSCQR